jgi:hypothetical protein
MDVFHVIDGTGPPNSRGPQFSAVQYDTVVRPRPSRPRLWLIGRRSWLQQETLRPEMTAPACSFASPAPILRSTDQRDCLFAISRDSRPCVTCFFFSHPEIAAASQVIRCLLAATQVVRSPPRRRLGCLTLQLRRKFHPHTRVSDSHSQENLEYQFKVILLVSESLHCDLSYIARKTWQCECATQPEKLDSATQWDPCPALNFSLRYET